ncbi:MAG TPA: LysM domain-containing protein [Luteimonas sp.]|jgi:hypothetical protein|nr:LysM domain-containing protein [Luteimonas sp.]
MPEVSKRGRQPRARRPRWRTVLAAALLVVGTWSVAADLRADHPDTYVVKKGDTLWDIAGRFLSKPWLWPEIWQANPQIANPHLIYPGDVVSLAYLDRVQQAVVAPGPRTEAPITGVPLDAVRPFLKDMRVVDDYHRLPYVVALEEDRLLGGQGQLAYAAELAMAPGQRVSILRPTQRFTFSDGDSAFGGNTLGYELMRVANAVVTRGEGNGAQASTLLIEGDSRDVRVGDRIVPAGAEGYDLQFFPHPPALQFPPGRAKVLSVADMLTTGGPNDVVTLSVGARDGVNNGTVFSVWRNGSAIVDRVYAGDFDAGWVPDEGRTHLPDEFAGHVMVFRTFDRVSYGLVMDSVKPTRVGYELKHPDATF